jgi:hypothetical protein
MLHSETLAQKLKKQKKRFPVFALTVLMTQADGVGGTGNPEK